MSEWTGGCCCGAVRFELASAPFDAGWCHCRTCQLNSGSPAMAFAAVRYADYQVVDGEDRVKRFASSIFGWRMFCSECGTPLGMHVDSAPESIDFRIATLDDPDALRPEFHIFYDSRISWAEACDALPRFARARPRETEA